MEPSVPPYNTRNARQQRPAANRQAPPPASSALSSPHGSPSSPAPPAPPAPPQQTRLDLYDYTVETNMSKLYGNGLNYSRPKFPQLQGSTNWAEWEEAILNAARAEHTLRLLELPGQPARVAKPTEPPMDCDNNTWNSYVTNFHRYERGNDNLLAGIKGNLSSYRSAAF